MKDNPLKESDLVKIPRSTMSKNMRNLADILADVVADPNVKLSDNEARLVDRHLFEKTGKHFGKFKDQKPKPKDETPSVGKSNDGSGEPKKKPLKVAGKSTVTPTESVS